MSQSHFGQRQYTFYSWLYTIETQKQETCFSRKLLPDWGANLQLIPEEKNCITDVSQILKCKRPFTMTCQILIQMNHFALEQHSDRREKLVFLYCILTGAYRKIGLLKRKASFSSKKIWPYFSSWWTTRLYQVLKKLWIDVRSLDIQICVSSLH